MPTDTAVIEDFTRTTYRPLFARDDIRMWVARLSLAGCSFTFSHREDDEEGAWYADALILANGMPSFVHGDGERSTAKHRAAVLVENMLNERMTRP